MELGVLHQSNGPGRTEKPGAKALPPSLLDSWQPRPTGISTLVLAGAAIGFVIGIVTWGALFLALVSGAQNFLDELSPLSSGVVSSGDEADASAIDCTVLGEREERTAEEEIAYESACITPTPETEDEAATATPAPPTATATTPPTDANRFNCNNIRGTNYRSQEERSWFLANCLTPTP